MNTHPSPSFYYGYEQLTPARHADSTSHRGSQIANCLGMLSRATRKHGGAPAEACDPGPLPAGKQEESQNPTVLQWKWQPGILHHWCKKHPPCTPQWEDVLEVLRHRRVSLFAFSYVFVTKLSSLH